MGWLVLFLRKTASKLRTIILPALLQNFRRIGDFLGIFSREIWWEIGGNFAGFFLIHRIKAQKFRGNFGAFSVRKFGAQNKNFRAKFTLQTCHQITILVATYYRGK